MPPQSPRRVEPGVGHGARERPFSSTLSANAFAIAQLDGLTPLAQVMGSAVVAPNWTSPAINGPWLRPGEIRPLSSAWNLARRLAFERMGAEAARVHADGVVGVQMRWREFDEEGTVELLVLGTAVRDAESRRRPGSSPTLGTLSAQEFALLRRSGTEPVGVVHHTAAWKEDAIRPSNVGVGGYAAGFGYSNQDVPEVAACVSRARRRAMAEVEKQARAVGANGIVVSDLRHHIDHTQRALLGPAAGGRQTGPQTIHSFYVVLHVVGTALKRGAHPASADTAITLELRGHRRGS